MADNEIDRWLNSARWDTAAERVRSSPKRVGEVVLSSAARQAALKARVKDILLLVFNDASSRSAERLAMICGHTDKFWKERLIDLLTKPGRPISRRTCQLFHDGMRAHMLGLRDHVNDIENELKKVANQTEDAATFTGVTIRESRRRAPPSRPRSL